MDNELTAETLLDRLNAELLDTWAATRAPTCTGRQLAGLYVRAGALRAEIARLEAERAEQTTEIGEVLAWLDGDGAGGGGFAL